MAKKRRKLDKDFEKIIYSAKKKIELILAKIYDINDEDIQKEYMSGFKEVIYFYEILKNDYDSVGFNENSNKIKVNYQQAISKFESEYEI